MLGVFLLVKLNGAGLVKLTPGSELVSSLIKNTASVLIGQSIKLSSSVISGFRSTVKPVYNGHPRDPKFVAVDDTWSLFGGRFLSLRLKFGLQNGGRCRQVVVIRRWSLTQV